MNEIAKSFCRFTGLLYLHTNAHLNGTVSATHIVKFIYLVAVIEVLY